MCIMSVCAGQWNHCVSMVYQKLSVNNKLRKGRVEEASARKNGRTDRNEQEERDALMKA